MAKSAVTDLELALARSLFRADKWNPARDKEAPFAWEDQRKGYVDAAKRLMRTFEKDGLVLSVAPASERLTQVDAAHVDAAAAG